MSYLLVLLRVVVFIQPIIAWVGNSGPVSVIVDDQTFAYTITVNGELWFGDGQVALQCGGHRYSSNPLAPEEMQLIRSSTVVVTGTDPALGPFEAIKQTWTANNCSAITTSIKDYHGTGLEFVTEVSADGAYETATTSSLVIDGNRPVTEFPSFTLPSMPAQGPGLITWHGSSTLGMFQNFPQPANLAQWSGGLEGGPVVFYSTGRAKGTTTAAVFGPSSEFKVGIVSRSGNRLVAGAQGMIAELPPNYTLSFVLVGTIDGITSGMMAFGVLLRKAHGTSNSKLGLSDDVLSRQLHYVNDGGSLLNYCDYWPQCINSPTRQFPDGPTGCTPMSFTLQKASEYHKSLGLNVSVYHVDPFWYSHEPLGGCSEGAMAKNFTASPWSFPDGLRSVGVPMMLFLQAFAADNVYASTGEYKWAGQSVSGADAARFFSDRFAELTSGKSVCSALTLDGVANVYYSAPERWNNTWHQAAYDRGLSDAALAHKMPIRIDQELPSDILASVQYGARTVGRCTYDANPCPGKNATGPWAPLPGPCSPDSRWIQLAGASLLLRALGMRPFTDVIWTRSIQSGDPRWGRGAKRPTVLHDLVVSVLTTGPVGFGDLINETDAELLATSLRIDGTILKPASSILRVERFYRPAPVGGSEIWAAVSGPAGGARSTNDARANSMAALGDTLTNEALWWWNILTTNVDDSLPSGAPLQISELWPQPPLSIRFLVAKIAETVSNGTEVRGQHACTDGKPASSCFALWDVESPLPVGAIGSAPVNGTKNFTLLAAAPILSSGWTLVGDLSKVVPCSPQRFVAPSTLDAPRDIDFRFHVDAELGFTVLGSQDEVVVVTLVAPVSHGSNPLDGLVVVLNIVVGASGVSHIECNSHSGTPRCIDRSVDRPLYM